MDNVQLDEIMSTIKDSVTMDALCNHLGIPITRNRTIVCPFHGDSHPSCKIYDGNRGYYCFVCHQGGDVFNFAQKYFKSDYYQTLCQLAPLAGIDIKSRQDNESARENHAKREQERIERERIHQEKLDEYHKWLDIFIANDKILPQKHTRIEDISDESARALRNIEYIKYRLDMATDNLRRE